MFKKGDKVVRNNGVNFSSGQKVAIVEFVSGDEVWLNTGTHIRASSLELYSEGAQAEDFIKTLEEKKEEIRTQIRELSEKLTVLETTIETLKELF